jgi:hypothetical protein
MERVGKTSEDHDVLTLTTSLVLHSQADNPSQVEVRQTRQIASCIYRDIEVGLDAVSAAKA